MPSFMKRMRIVSPRLAVSGSVAGKLLPLKVYRAVVEDEHVVVIHALDGPR